MSKCLLFDCDGTLVDSEILCNVGMVQCFAPYGIKLEAEALVKEFRGWKLAKILELLQSRYEVQLDDDFEPQYRERVANLFESELRPVENIEFALQHLQQPKAVVSSGPREKIAQALRICGLAHHFGANIFSSYDVGIWKPDPEIYRHSARAMGFDFADCAVIDDGPVGIEAGVNAGMKTYFYNVYGESCPFPEAVSFNSMLELPELVQA